MFTVELYGKIRRAVMIEGLSRREAARRFGVHRNTIAKTGYPLHARLVADRCVCPPLIAL